MAIKPKLRDTFVLIKFQLLSSRSIKIAVFTYDKIIGGCLTDLNSLQEP